MASKMIVPKVAQVEVAIPMYSIELCKTTIRLLDEARIHARKHPEKYDAETIKDLDTRIKKWGERLAPMLLESQNNA